MKVGAVSHYLLPLTFSLDTKSATSYFRKILKSHATMRMCKVVSTTLNKSNNTGNSAGSCLYFWPLSLSSQCSDTHLS